MRKEQDYLQDIVEIRNMMERSSKFLSLSGWAGIMAGIYALIGAYLAYSVFLFNPDSLFYKLPGSPSNLFKLGLLAFVILVLALSTAIWLSKKKAARKNEKVWNPIAQQLLAALAVPLLTGGLFLLILVSWGLTGLLAPASLVFYGLALFNAGQYTYKEIKTLGIIQIVLGLIGCYYIEHGFLLWTMGFGVLHIIYGIYMDYKYEK